MRSSNEERARSIWPTGKPARPVSARDVEAHCAKVRLRLAYGYHPVQVKALLPEAFAAFVHDRRTRGIAKGLWLARRRMERWLEHLAWSSACEGGLRFARRCLSPEHAMLSAAARHGEAEGTYPRWYVGTSRLFSPETETGVYRADKLGKLAFLAFIRDLVDSPEWAALPWQREGGR